MYVGLDVHKDFCQAAFLDFDGKLVREERFENTVSGLEELAQATREQEVVMESSTSSMHVYDALSGTCKVKVAHPSRVKAIASARIKTDKIDARILAHLLRADLIPESYVPSKECRQARLLVRQRASLVEVRTQIKNKIHALLTREGVKIPFKDSFGKKTILFLKSVDIGEAQRASLNSLMTILDALNKEVKEADKNIKFYALEDKYAKLLVTHTGVGWLTALAVSSEICDISRFESHKKLCSYFGLVPSVYQSGNADRKGHITKQGNTLLRSLLIQCAWSAVKYSPRFRRKYNKLRKKTGNQKAIVAVARTIAVDMYFMMVRNEEYKEPKNESKGGKPVSLLGP
ncbi:IS110 family transposase [archaeon]|nr:IS110 family transposase [archaeon]